MDTIVAPWPPPLTNTVVATKNAAIERPVREPRPSRLRRSLGGLTVAVLIGLALWLDLSPIGVLLILFVMVVPFEKMFPRHRGQKLRRPQVLTDITHALALPALTIGGTAVAIVVGIASLAWIPGLMLRPFVGMIPAAILPFVGIALFDLAIYWVHRWSHEVPFLWRFHSVHHSTEQLDWVSGFRNHPFDGAIVAPPFFLLLAAGFDATFTGVVAIVQLVTGLFLHANVRWKLKLLHRVVITPEFHHWHHANETDAHNSNYSVFLPIWDTVFGTYFMPNDRRPQVYGISEDMPTTLLGQLHHPLRGAGRPDRIAWRMIRSPWKSLRATLRFTRSIVGDIWRSTRRPVRGVG